MAAESTKTKSKSTDTKAGSSAKDSKEASASKEDSSASGDAPANYSRGEGQKVVSKRYLRNWDTVFGQKRRPAK